MEGFVRGGGGGKEEKDLSREKMDLLGIVEIIPRDVAASMTFGIGNLILCMHAL